MVEVLATINTTEAMIIRLSLWCQDIKMRGVKKLC